MPEFYSYQNALLGTQTTINGAAPNYGAGPGTGGTWSWSGTSTSFLVTENDGAFNFNGDGPGNGLVNEEIAAQEQIGGTWQQTVEIGGADRVAIWDYTFELTAADGTVYRVAVIDVDLNNDADVGQGNNAGDPGEDGYFLVFPDGIPPPDTDLTIGPIVANGPSVTHASLGAQVVCFCRGTRIATPDGITLIEDLCTGDRVMTQDNGRQAIRWIGSRKIGLGPGEAFDRFRPVRITAGALGQGYPIRDLLVSRQHRMFVSSKISMRMFNAQDALVAAIKLTELPGIFVDHDIEEVEYFHILLDRHEIVFAEGAPSESLFAGPEALKTVPQECVDEILTIFPELETVDCRPEAARVMPSGKHQKQLVARHLKNRKAILETYDLH